MTRGEAVAALAPVRAALLSAARADAARTRDRADRAAGEVLARATAEADGLVAGSREQGAADAADVLTAQRARVRREARATVLRAQSSAYEDLRRQAREMAVARVACRPGVADRLAAAARARLGPEATVETADDGTVVATCRARRWAWSPLTLADRVVDELGAEVEKLWAP